MPASRRATLWAVGVMALLIGAACLSTRWSGYEIRSWKACVVAVPVLGAALLVATPLAWILDRKRDFLGVRARRPTYVLVLLIGMWLLATVPLGDVLMRRSAQVSMERARDVIAAAEAFHAAHGGRLPSAEELDRDAGRRLPRPTLGRQFVFLSRDDDLRIEFGTDSVLGHWRWQYDMAAKTWTEYGD